MSRPRIAIAYGAICGGCDVSLVNTGEKLAELLEKYDIIYWSIAVDGRRDILENIDSIDVAIFMGSIRTSEHKELAKLLREKARLRIAYGTCSIYGGIPGLAAIYRPSDINKIVSETITTTIRDNNLNRPYKEGESLELPELLEIPYPSIDAFDPQILVPGCPPSVETVENLIDILIEYTKGWRPESKIFLGEENENTLCSKCPRKPEDMTKIVMPGIYRLYEREIDENKCFLEQGILCMGPVTRLACKHQCIKNNMPCIGCMGPVASIDDPGLKMLSSIASLLLVDKEKTLLEKGLARELDKIVDPHGMFYKYTLPSSLLMKIVLRRRGKDDL